MTHRMLFKLTKRFLKDVILIFLLYIQPFCTLILMHWSKYIIVTSFKKFSWTNMNLYNLVMGKKITKFIGFHNETRTKASSMLNLDRETIITRIKIWHVRTKIQQDFIERNKQKPNKDMKRKHIQNMYWTY